MDGLSVFNFSNYRDFLRASATRPPRSQGSRRYTLEEWSRKLGYRSPRSIAMVLKGQRLPSAEMVLKLSKNLRLSRAEQVYFDLLVSLERNRRSGKGTDHVLGELERLHPKIAGETHLTFENFAYISRWYCLVIKQLIATPSFREDLAWIRRRLRRKISLSEIQAAIQTLLKLKLVERTRQGRLTVREKTISTGTDILSAAIQLHHKQMITRAAEAITEQNVNAREITSVTLRMDPKRIDEAKKRIREFRDLFNKDFSSDQSEAIWQINLQLFEHTDRRYA